VRRIVLGDGARDDHELTDLLGDLRAKANWSFLRPTDRRTRERFLRRLADHVARAEPGSLAAMMAATPTTSVTEPVQQVPQWLFAFEPAGMAAFRALALIDAHPSWSAQVREDLAGRDLAGPQELPSARDQRARVAAAVADDPGHPARDHRADPVGPRACCQPGPAC
jgi:hypothetical protein